MNGLESRSLIGQDPVFLEVLEHVSRLGSLNRPVLVLGERGTGKELIAARLHYLSRRWDQPFVKLNCAALPETLLETELFGHEAGAFTGATRRHRGRFERAAGGSLFLDEIASMSMRVQEKLLRVIEYGEFERVGGTQTLQADVRIIAAANVDLPSLAREGKFREDLLDRLSFDVVTLPPLRARQEDIPVLAEHFALGMVRELGREYFPGFSDGALEAMRRWPWPGNVRELKNVIERAVYKSEEGRPVESLDFDPFDSPWRLGTPASSAVAREKAAKQTAEEGPDPAAGPYDFKAEVERLERRLLEGALRANRFNQRRTAEYLGLTYHQLRGYLRKYELLSAPRTPE